MSTLSSTTNQPNPSSSSTNRRRQRQNSSSQPHHVMTQPVFIQKFLPYAAITAQAPVAFKTVTTSWEETNLHFHGAQCCWGAFFKKYKNKSNNDDDADKDAEHDPSAKEILQLLGTAFEKIEHPDSLWIVDSLFKVLTEHLTVSIPPEEDSESVHFKVFASLFKSEIAVKTGNMVIYFDKLFALFNHDEAVGVLLPAILTKQLDPYDLPACMDGILTKMTDEIVKNWKFRCVSVGARCTIHKIVPCPQLKDLATFLCSCFKEFPTNYVVVKHLLCKARTVLTWEYEELHRRPLDNFDGIKKFDCSGGIEFLVWDECCIFSTDNVFAFAMQQSTPEIVKMIISFTDKHCGKKFLEDVFMFEPGADDEPHRRSTLIMNDDFKLENFAAAIDQFIAVFGGDYFVKLLFDEEDQPFFFEAAYDRNVEKVALLINKIRKVGGNKAVKSVIEAQSVFSFYDGVSDVTEKSSIHFAIERGQMEMVKYLIEVAESFGEGYLEYFISVVGYCSDCYLELPPLYFALKQSNAHVTKFIVKKVRSIGKRFLRDQIDAVFDFGENEDWDDRGYSFETTSDLISKLFKFAGWSEVKLLIERNLEEYTIDEFRSFIHQLESVELAKSFVDILKKVDGFDSLREALMHKRSPKKDEDEDGRVLTISADVRKYLEEVLKSAETDEEAADDDLEMK